MPIGVLTISIGNGYRVPLTFINTFAAIAPWPLAKRRIRKYTAGEADLASSWSHLFSLRRFSPQATPTTIRQEWQLHSQMAPSIQEHAQSVYLYTVGSTY